MSVPATRANAAHLLRRAAFGGLPGEVDAVAFEGIDTAVERLLHEAELDDGVPPLPDGIPSVDDQWEGIADWMTEKLRADWLVRMVHPPNLGVGVREKLTLFWHGHFATSMEKVEADRLMWRQYQALRAGALGSFPELVRAVSRDTAMNVWLDLWDSTAEAPNENWARELLELFVLGRGQGYTQADVVAAARAFTGYSYDEEDDYAFWFDEDVHDRGVKTFLGHTGRLTGDDVITLATTRAEAGRHLARRLWARYASVAEPPAGLVDDLATVYAERREVRDVLRALWTHPAFYAPDVVGSLVATPVEWFVRARRAMAVPAGEVAEWGEWEPEWMGQSLFSPPNVGGWPPATAWLSTSTCAIRALSARSLGWWAADAASGGDPLWRSLEALLPDRRAFTEALLGRLGVVEVSEGTAGALVEYLAGYAGAVDGGDTWDVLAGAVTLALLSPEVVCL